MRNVEAWWLGVGEGVAAGGRMGVEGLMWKDTGKWMCLVMGMRRR